jgi:hypothetical protein
LVFDPRAAELGGDDGAAGDGPPSFFSLAGHVLRRGGRPESIVTIGTIVTFGKVLPGIVSEATSE